MIKDTKELIECVPNFSEGKDLAKIREITKTIDSTPGVGLLGVEENGDYNRVVVTFAGGPIGVREAAFRSIARAVELIDMSVQKGHHPRIGAADVCPFVPISGVTMEDCVVLAKALGKEVGEKLGIPVYLYGEAAKVSERTNLSNVRRGEYEGLEEKLKDPEWRPDFGPCEYNDRVKKTGAIAIGARKLLIAYNISLNTSDVGLANKIAGRLRESGVVTNRGGKRVRIPGRLKKVQAMAVPMESGVTEISMNLLDYDVTPPHVAFEAVKGEVKGPGVEIIGSEIVGLVTKMPLLMAGRFYGCSGTDRELIETAVKGLRLLKFDPNRKIIEYATGLGFCNLTS
ncbi:MAG: glutamate formimidoyltransferase [Planctomycetes bacterium RIFCSPLOWO2_12_FULL_50_35]|nr:MAG: glutamate formimidoyltransferase [Planctomycetes bacterium RIFCSPHIGHO2_12_FULL_51_37]OHB94883.1 MAG: glutamate formimidoyltransferase [Planctomycetes bacterium RIFCSPLOWO2_02_FULL_50_16]OHC02567.1 MAG: glutamate formimidoyltransferase [Planctomycetes bacterium RIFCSPLOWO2_12_FULL_50_35]